MCLACGDNMMFIDGTTGDISFYEDTGTTAKLTWDASAEVLEVNKLSALGDQNTKLDLNIANTARIFTGGLERMRITSAGSVGIGTSSPSAKLSVTGLAMNSASSGVELEGSWPWLKFKDTEANQDSWLQYIDASNFIIKQIDYDDRNSAPSTVGTERMRIDSNGNVLVGTTSESNWETVAGFRTRQSGSTTITRSAAPVLYANRLTSDGDIMEFRKDGSTVGSIGAYNSATGIISGSAASYTGIYLNTNKIEPAGNNFGSEIRADNTVDVGSSSYRFKDLYLSGDIAHKDAAGNARLLYDKSANLLGNAGTYLYGFGVYLGGNGSANLLDDYEEGSWTPVISSTNGFSGDPTPSSTSGKYTKIGNFVRCTGVFTFSSAKTHTEYSYVGGLPFLSNAGGETQAAGVYNSFGANDQNPTGTVRVGITSSQFSLLRLESAPNTSNDRWIFAFSYHTDA